MKNENPMRNIKIEKVVLSVGGTAEELEKGFKLLQLITGRKQQNDYKKKNSDMGLDQNFKFEQCNSKKDADKMLKDYYARLKISLRKNSCEKIFHRIKEYIEIPRWNTKRIE